VRLLDLAARSVGGSVMAANDASFGEKEHLVVDAPPDFVPGRFGHQGEIVDGWETRRRRDEGDDWAVVRLGVPGVVRAVDVDTRFFTGNFPTHAMVEGCSLDGYPSASEVTGASVSWDTLVPWTELQGDAHNEVPVESTRRITHVRLRIRPDGGVARLRVRGVAVPDPQLVDGLTVDLLARELGGLIVASSDDFYSDAAVLNRRDQARTMGEGWETRRRRGAGHDWVIARLACESTPLVLEVDTAYYVHNASAAIEVHSVSAPTPPAPDSQLWRPMLGRTALLPDQLHRFALDPAGDATHLRVDVFPDGGLSRLRVIGRPTAAGRRNLGVAWWNSLTPDAAARQLTDLGVDPADAAQAAAERPLCDDATAHTLRAGSLGSLSPSLRDAVTSRILGPADDRS
jgi:allantoicase